MILKSTRAGSRSSPLRIGFEATGSDRGSLPRRPANNKMQLTRSGHSRWRPSQLILVLSSRRQWIMRPVIAGVLSVSLSTCSSEPTSSQRAQRIKDGLTTGMTVAEVVRHAESVDRRSAVHAGNCHEIDQWTLRREGDGYVFLTVSRPQYRESRTRFGTREEATDAAEKLVGRCERGGVSVEDWEVPFLLRDGRISSVGVASKRPYD
jgi:hypothetical protein